MSVHFAFFLRLELVHSTTQLNTYGLVSLISYSLHHMPVLTDESTALAFLLQWIPFLWHWSSSVCSDTKIKTFTVNAVQMQ